jgi:hypothetical protein
VQLAAACITRVSRGLRVRALGDVTRFEEMPGNCYRIVVKDELEASYERTFERDEARGGRRRN